MLARRWQPSRCLARPEMPTRGTKAGFDGLAVLPPVGARLQPASTICRETLIFARACGLSSKRRDVVGFATARGRARAGSGLRDVDLRSRLAGRRLLRPRAAPSLLRTSTARTRCAARRREPGRRARSQHQHVHAAGNSRPRAACRRGAAPRRRAAVPFELDDDRSRSPPARSRDRGQRSPSSR